MMFVAWALMQAQAVPPPLPPLHGGNAPMTCPVGGEAFQGWQMGSYSTYGERPDGRPYSYMHFPFPVPECPSNHLVVFDSFSEADKAALTKLIATPAYARLVADGETPHYRAFWLATRLGRPEAQALGWLQAALWAQTPGRNEGADQPDSQPRRMRYAAEFVDRVRHLPADISSRDRLWLTARAANLLRQKGDFSDAETLRQDALSLVGQPDVGDGWDRYLGQLGTVIARQDSAVEPLDMIPAREAARYCAEPDKVGLSAPDIRLCKASEIGKDATRLHPLR